MNLGKITRLATLLAISLTLSILESFIPLLNGIIPGFKLGLANIVIIVTLYLYGIKDAILVSILRVILMGFLRTGIFSTTFFFSLGGAVLSIISMSIMKQINKLSIIGISIIGAITHSLGQILISFILLKNTNLLNYLPFLLILSTISGIIIGYISKELIINLRRIKL